MKTKREKTHQPQTLVAEVIANHGVRQRPNTQGVNHALVQQLDVFTGRPTRVSDLTEEYCISFAEFLATRVAIGSVRTYLQKMHAILECAAVEHLIPSNPMPPLRMLIPRNRNSQRVYLEQEEIARLVDTPCRHEETKRAFLFACQTGLRLSDIETLSWDDISVVNGKPTIVKVQVKTGREVSVPLNVLALELLGERHSSSKVFMLKSRSIIATDLTQWAKDAGLGKHLTFHVSRHTFATLSISAGVDIYVVSRLCGHTTVRTTEIYAHIVDKTLQQGVALLEKSMINDTAIGRKTERNRLKERIKKTLYPLFQRLHVRNTMFYKLQNLNI